MPSPSHRIMGPRTWTLASSVAVVALGATGFLWRSTGIATLTSLFPNSPNMRANTAAAMMFCGIALALLSQREPPKFPRRLATAFAILVAAIGALTLTEYLFGWSLGIDQLLSHEDASQTMLGYSSRMPSTVALCFVFAGIALFLAAMDNGLRWRWPLLSALGASITLMATMVLAGYLLKALLHTDLAVYPGVAPNAAAGFVILGLGLLAFVRGAGHLTWSVSASPTRGILLGGTCLLLFALLSTIFTFQFQQDHQWVSHTQEVLKEIESMTRSMGDLVSSARGYLVSAEEHLLAQRAQSQAAVREHFAVLRGLTADNPRQQRRLDQLEPLIARRDMLWEQLIALRRQAGPAAPVLQPAAAAENAVSNDIRVLLKEMRDDEYDLLDRRSAQTNASASRTFLLLPLGLFLSLTTLCVALFFLNAGVGEQHQAERSLLEAHEKLRSSEENLRLMISGVKDYSILTLDPDGLVATWNLGAQRLKGWSAEEIIGQHFSRFYSREEAADHVPHRELEIAKAEGQFVGEGWRIRKDGSRFWASVVITRVVHDDGLFVGFSKVTRDTTERRRIEHAMKEEEARLAAVIGSAMDAVITVDEHQNVTLFNPAAEKMFGYNAPAVMGSSLERLIPPRFRGSHASHIRTFADTNTTRRKMGALTPIYGLRANGEEFPIEASISQAQIGGQKIFSVILRDISERNRVEEALRQQASLLDLAPVLVRDMQSHIVFWSSGLEKLYNYSKSEAVGSISHHLLHSEFPIPLEQIERSLELQGSWEGELLHRSRDGSRVIVNSLWVLYRDAQGQPIRILEVNADITARKRAEALQQRSQKLESLGTLSGGIAHDFNNILLAITGNTKLAIADLPPEHPVQQSLSEIAKAGSRATDLVRRILTFSRPSEIKRQILELQPVVEEALKLVRATLPATVEFRTTFAPNLPTVLADSTQVHQIIVNLATNAAHAIGAKSDGLIEIRLDAAKLTVDDSDHSLNLPEGTYVRLYVSDNGCGMDRGTLDRIYDPFFTTKGPGEGTGLGLSVVHGIMKNHDGGIAVYSEPGRGTAFRLFFPAAGSAPAAAQESHSEVQRQRTERILYVDDEEALVVLVTRTLQRLGYKVTGQTDPAKALELFRADPAQFDAVVTDLAMPQLSGFDLASQLLTARPDIPIVMTSGYVRVEDQERALHMGLRDLILKPDTIEQLGRTLDRVFQKEPTPSKPISH
jgi:PAS domain S-box-containing protein